MPLKTRNVFEKTVAIEEATIEELKSQLALRDELAVEETIMQLIELLFRWGPLNAGPRKPARLASVLRTRR